MMADETKPAAAEPKAAPPQHVQALGEMVNAAAALQQIQAQAMREAMQLPEKRLDDASSDGGASPFTLRDDGGGKFTKIDAWGKEV
jgi:hypothetical protein